MISAINQWAQILKDPFFRDIPYKVETTKAGAIMMSPASNWHGRAQFDVGYSIKRGRKSGVVINECSILTSDGVKVADVAWASDEFISKHGYKTPYVIAPELCVEVVSPGNSDFEIENKVNAYLAKGAIEVWVVLDDKHINFFSNVGRLKRSKMVKTIELGK